MKRSRSERSSVRQASMVAVIHGPSELALEWRRSMVAVRDKSNEVKLKYDGSLSFDDVGATDDEGEWEVCHGFTGFE